MKNGDKIYVVRYSTKDYEKCIEDHEAICEQYGYCWFAKCGKKISSATLDTILLEKAKVLLYSREKSYLADLEGYSFSIPNEAVPAYYNDYLYLNMERIAVFLKLRNISKLVTDITGNLRAISTGRIVENIFRHSSCSNLYAIYESDEEKNKRTECVYNHEGFCENAKSVNYMYKCERPKACEKFE